MLCKLFKQFFSFWQVGLVCILWASVLTKKRLPWLSMDVGKTNWIWLQLGVKTCGRLDLGFTVHRPFSLKDWSTTKGGGDV